MPISLPFHSHFPSSGHIITTMWLWPHPSDAFLFPTLPLLQSVLNIAISLTILHSHGIMPQRGTLSVVSHRPNTQPYLLHRSLQLLQGPAHSCFTTSFLATFISNSAFQISRITINSLNVLHALRLCTHHSFFLKFSFPSAHPSSPVCLANSSPLSVVPSLCSFHLSFTHSEFG